MFNKECPASDQQRQIVAAPLHGANGAITGITGTPAQTRFEKLENSTQHSDHGIRYYSGMATYRSSFNVDAAAISSVGPRLRPGSP